MIGPGFDENLNTGIHVELKAVGARRKPQGDDYGAYRTERCDPVRKRIYEVPVCLVQPEKGDCYAEKGAEWETRSIMLNCQ